MLIFPLDSLISPLQTQTPLFSYMVLDRIRQNVAYEQIDIVMSALDILPVMVAAAV